MSMRKNQASSYQRLKHRNDIKKGEIIGEIVNPLEGTVEERLYAPCDGLIFYTEGLSDGGERFSDCQDSGRWRPMRQELIYSMKNIHRDDFNIYGYRFGKKTE